MPDIYIETDINLVGLRDDYLLTLQRLVDTAGLICTGARHVTPEQLEDSRFRLTMNPAPTGPTDLGELREHVNSLVVPGFLRDAVAATEQFVADARYICDLFDFVAKNKADLTHVQHLADRVNGRRAKLRKDRFSDALDALPKVLGVSSLTFGKHVDSIRLARNCIMHNDAVVGPQHVNVGGYHTLYLRTVKIMVRDKATGEGFELLDRVLSTTHGADADMIHTEIERAFEVGQPLKLIEDDLFGITMTLAHFANEVTQLLEARGKSLGLEDGEHTVKMEGEDGTA